jgi:hypothetical protein
LHLIGLLSSYFAHDARSQEPKNISLIYVAIYLNNFSNELESKLAKFLQSIGTIKRNIFRKMRTESNLKIYSTLVLPTFLYRPENWTLIASQRRRIEAADIKLLRPLAGYIRPL